MVISHSSNHHSKTPSGDHFFQKIRWCGKIKTQGTLAEWLRSGLQNRVHQFNSGRCLHFFVADFYGQINALDIGDAAHRITIITLLGAAGAGSGIVKTKHVPVPG